MPPPIHPLRPLVRRRGRVLQLCDEEVVESFSRFQTLLLFRSLLLWGTEVSSLIEETMHNLKKYISSIIAFGNQFGSTDDVAQFLEHKDRLQSLRGIKPTQTMEHYLLAVVLPSRQRNHIYRYVNTASKNATLQEIDTMTFRPLLAYIKKIEMILDNYAYLSEPCEENPQGDPERKPGFERLLRECRERHQALKQHQIMWIADQKLDPDGNIVVRSLPWDYVYQFFCSFVDDVYIEAKKVKDKGVDWQMVTHHHRIASYDNKRPSERLEAILGDLKHSGSFYYTI